MEVTREEAVRQAERGFDPSEPDWEPDAEDFRALARTVVALYDEREDLKKQYQSLLIDSMQTATAQRECIDRLRSGWKPINSAAGGWRWYRFSQETELVEDEPMTPEQQAVMAR